MLSVVLLPGYSGALRCAHRKSQVLLVVWEVLSWLNGAGSLTSPVVSALLTHSARATLLWV